MRAEYYLKRMQELGFKDASIDSEGNVIALRKGTGGGRPKLVVSAHLDTVFPEGIDVTVKEKDGAIAGARHRRRFARAGGVVVAGQNHERERHRDRRRHHGGRHRRRGRARQSPRRQGAVPRPQGHRRLHLDRRARHQPRRQPGDRQPPLRDDVQGPRRSFVSGIRPAERDPRHGPRDRKNLRPAAPSDPKTTFTVGTVSGGTSVNAIAGEAKMAVDMRSNSDGRTFEARGAPARSGQGSGRRTKTRAGNPTRSRSRSG